MPVPAGMRRPTMTFSLRPRRWSTRPAMLASVSTRVVSWNEAAEMKLSVESEAPLMPRRSGVPSAGSPPRFITFSFFSMKRKDRPAQYCVTGEEVRIADAGHANGTEHMAADHFDVLVFDCY